MDIHLAPPFPSRLMTPHATFDRVRVAYVDGRLHVWGVNDAHQPVEVAAVDVPPVAMENRFPYRFTTVDGEEWVVDAGHGCGCGHVLKRARLLDLLALSPTP